MTQRGTASLTVALNQNTAPVNEYRCLYTHDVFKKQKKWHDGSLRFHTFNARVMVYDDARNYIGDLHYRQDEAFGEGTEIQLDRGVKVEVCEALGQTQTDLAPLLDRQRGDQNGVPSQRTPGTRRAGLTPKPPHERVGGRPKSLADLLGASQGRSGRSNLLAQSPFEQRQALLGRQVEAPSPKRRKIVSGKENAIELGISQPQGVANAMLPVAVSAAYGNDKAIQKVAMSQPVDNVIDLLSDDDQQIMSSRPKSLKAAPMNKQSAVVESSKNSSRENAGQARSAEERRHEATLKLKASVLEERSHKKGKDGNKGAVCAPVRRKDCKPLAHMAASNTALVGAEERGKPGQKSGMTRLVLSQPKKVKKLMYRALLPCSAVSTVQKDPSTTRSSRALSPAVSLSRVSVVSSPDSSPITPKTARQSYGRSCNTNETATRIEEREGTNDGSETFLESLQSPLFVREDSHQALPASQPFDEAALEIPELETHPEVRGSPIKTPTSIEEPDDRARQATEQTRVPSVLSQLDQKLMGRPSTTTMSAALLLDRQSPAKRPFRRVFSENDSPSKSGPRDRVAGNRIPSVLQSMQSKASGGRNPCPSKLQRSASDTATLEVTGEGIVPRKPLKQVEEEGPWTSFEAFLLFDWWPPNLEKPDYALYPVVGRATTER